MGEWFIRNKAAPPPGRRILADIIGGGGGMNNGIKRREFDIKKMRKKKYEFDKGWNLCQRKIKINVRTKSKYRNMQRREKYHFQRGWAAWMVFRKIIRPLNRCELQDKKSKSRPQKGGGQWNFGTGKLRWIFQVPASIYHT
jgi:hypothetical protein